LVLDKDLTGERLFQAVTSVGAQLEPMAAAARGLARPGATRRIADLLEELIDT
jgi:UDP-N-acetylglucosamine:LPS N-acetylglucosamine transferase